MRASGRFLSEASSASRIPVVLLSGFLGSGKTTLVNALLAQPSMAGTAVAVNEFGPVALDRNFVDHGPHSTVVLANGCLCCNLGGDVESAVLRLFTSAGSATVPPLRRLIIEPSGLADPTPIAQSILRNPLLARALRLEAIITTIDGQFGAKQMGRHAEMRPQLAMADRILITKPDLACAAALDDLAARLRSVNPLAPIQSIRDGMIGADDLLPAAFLDPAAMPDARPRSPLVAQAVPAQAGHLEGVASVALQATRPLAWLPFEAWLRRTRLSHADALLRLKGLVDIAGHNGPVLLNGIHHVLHAPVELGAWPEDERLSRMVVIADAQTCATIAASWNADLPALLAA